MGLYELVEETEKSDILKNLFENCFPTWLSILSEKIRNHNKFGIKFGNNINFDSIIALLASAVKNNIENVNKCISKDLIPYIADITNDSDWT